MADKGKGCGCIGFVFVGILALSALSQCFGGGSGSESSKPSESSSQLDKVIVQTTEAVKTTTATTVELEFKDKELNIYYERPTGTPSIKLGDEGDDVGWVQCAICKALNTTLPIHCGFDTDLEAKVIEFQSRAGLSADGIVGPATINALVDVISGNKELSKATEPPKATQPPVIHTDPPVVQPPAQQQPVSMTYILNTNTKKFHYSSCSSVNQIKDSNKSSYTGSRDDLIAQGYDPCKKCNP